MQNLSRERSASEADAALLNAKTHVYRFLARINFRLSLGGEASAL
jgi:hypothetical protein